MALLAVGVKRNDWNAEPVGVVPFVHLALGVPRGVCGVCAMSGRSRGVS